MMSDTRSVRTLSCEMAVIDFAGDGPQVVRCFVALHTPKRVTLFAGLYFFVLTVSMTIGKAFVTNDINTTITLLRTQFFSCPTGMGITTGFACSSRHTFTVAVATTTMAPDATTTLDRAPI